MSAWWKRMVFKKVADGGGANGGLPPNYDACLAHDLDLFSLAYC